MTDVECTNELSQGLPHVSNSFQKAEKGNSRVISMECTVSDQNMAAMEWNHVERFRFRNSFMKIIEELRMRRISNAESERRIQNLVQQKYELERKLDQESNRLTGIEEEHKKEVEHVKRNLEDNMKSLKTEVSQQQVYRKMAEKECETLKDEIRNLQLSNYSLDKQVTELQRKLQVQVNAVEQQLQQLSDFQSKHQAILSQGKQLSDTQDRLDKNGLPGIYLHRF